MIPTDGQRSVQSKDMSIDERKKWDEYCRQRKREEDIIEHYAYIIRGEKPDYELMFDENLVEEVEGSNTAIRESNELIGSVLTIETKPEGMTKTQWQKEKSWKGRLAREESKQREADRNLELFSNPGYMLQQRIEKIGCRCKAERMRQGQFCTTCQLLVRVNEYLLDRFKIASMRSEEQNK